MFSDDDSTHFATFLLLQLKRLQLNLICASNRAVWAIDP